MMAVSNGWTQEVTLAYIIVEAILLFIDNVSNGVVYLFILVNLILC